MERPRLDISACSAGACEREETGLPEPRALDLLTVERPALTRTVRRMDYSNAEPAIVLPAVGEPDRATAAHRAEEPTVTVESAGMLVAAIPLFFGFRPEDSVVILGLRSAPKAAQPARLRCAFRLDLDDIGQGSTSITDVLDRLHRHNAEQVLLVAFAPRAAAEPLGSGLQDYRTAIDELAARIGEAGGLPVLDAMYVANGRWWSYLCSSVCCWPEVGTPVPAEPPAALLAVPQFRNTTVAGSRLELEQSLKPYGEDRTRSMASALAAASAGSSDGLDVEAARQLADTLLQRCGADSVDVTDEEGAALLMSLRHHLVRDHLAVAAADVDGAVRLQTLATELARRAPSEEFRPAPYSLAAWAAWALGRTAVARCAVAHALAADPDYTFTRLIDAGLRHGIAPGHVREAATKSRGELDATPDTPEFVAAAPVPRSSRRPSARARTA